jgi:hypothetical protein
MQDTSHIHIVRDWYERHPEFWPADFPTMHEIALHQERLSPAEREPTPMWMLVMLEVAMVLATAAVALVLHFRH